MAMSTDNAIDEMVQIIRYVTREGWDYEVTGGDPASFEINVFGGRIQLRSDGTWSYEED
jgi:hypothetical protein